MGGSTPTPDDKDEFPQLKNGKVSVANVRIFLSIYVISVDQFPSTKLFIITLIIGSSQSVTDMRIPKPILVVLKSILQTPKRLWMLQYNFWTPNRLRIYFFQSWRQLVYGTISYMMLIAC